MRLSWRRPIKWTDKWSDWPIALMVSPLPPIRRCWPGGPRPVRSSRTTCPLTFGLSSTWSCWLKPCCPTLCPSTLLQKYYKAVCSQVNVSNFLFQLLTLPQSISGYFICRKVPSIIVCCHEKDHGLRLTVDLHFACCSGWREDNTGPKKTLCTF